MADATVMTMPSETWVSVDQWAALMGCSVRTAFRRAASGSVERMAGPDGSVRLRLPPTAALPVSRDPGLGDLPALVASVMTAKREAEGKAATALAEAQQARQMAARASRRTLVASALAASVVMTAGAWYMTASASMSERLRDAAARLSAAEQGRAAAMDQAAQSTAMAAQRAMS